MKYINVKNDNNNKYITYSAVCLFHDETKLEREQIILFMYHKNCIGTICFTFKQH